MPVDLTIVESTTELGQTVVEVVLEGASEPGPAGPGVPVGGTVGQVLTKDSSTDFDSSWQDAGGAGSFAPIGADYLVGTANGTLTSEIVVGTSPGGELGGTWAAPTVDATHSGSSHAGVQAAAEATAAAALAAHEADTTSVHGIADTSALALTANHPTNATFNDHSARHENGGADEISLAGLDGTPTDLQTHLDDATAAHAGSAISVDSTTLSGTGTTVQASLEELDNLLDDHSSRHENGGADEISIAGLDGTPTELTNHLNDASAAHDASAISFTPAGSIAATNVQDAIEEVATEAGGAGVPDFQYESRSSNTILGTADKGKTIDITAAITQTFEADETLGDGWWVILRNATDDGTTVVTLNPAGTETIDGLTTVTMYSGEARMIFCNGAGGNFNSVLLEGGFARFTADGDFIVPHGITQATIECIGGGGGAGGGASFNASSVCQGGSGGGGGARTRIEIGAAQLGNPGDTIAVDVATGGTGGAGGTGAGGSNGTAGGNTTFGSVLTGYGGGHGQGGTSTGVKPGAGGGGAGEAGGNSTSTAATRGGGNPTAGAGGMGGAGAGQNASTAGAGAEYGGGCGGIPTTAGGTGTSGGSSTWGGAGGASGSGNTGGNVDSAAQSGGAVGVFQAAATGGGGTGGAVDGGAGGNGADGDLLVCGEGGGGGGSFTAGAGGDGGNGGAPGGGGGGGGGGRNPAAGGTGGDGGRGECRVWFS